MCARAATSVHTIHKRRRRSHKALEADLYSMSGAMPALLSPTEPAKTALLSACLHILRQADTGRNSVDFPIEQTYLNFIDEQPKWLLL
jgi:hypothetical protein